MIQDNMVEVHELSKFYSGGTCALEEVSLLVGRGEWLAIMGPSGSGKTTFLNIVGCLDRPSKGLVLIDGKDIFAFTPNELIRFRRETVGLIFQQFHLVPYLNAVENVMLAQYFHSMVDEDEACQALQRVQLGHRIHHLPSQLSGGEQQRVCIARALINSPKILLADEPTGNLDKQNEELVLDLFRQIHSEGHTVIMVTHDPDVARLADRIVTLDHGKVAATTLPPVPSTSAAGTS